MREQVSVRGFFRHIAPVDGPSELAVLHERGSRALHVRQVCRVFFWGWNNAFFNSQQEAAVSIWREYVEPTADPKEHQRLSVHDSLVHRFGTLTFWINQFRQNVWTSLLSVVAQK